MVYFPAESKPRLADHWSVEDVALLLLGLEWENKQPLCAFKRFYLNLIIFVVAKKDEEKNQEFLL